MRDTKIALRTTRELKESLDEFARLGGRTVSSVIHEALRGFLLQRDRNAGERRRYPRSEDHLMATALVEGCSQPYRGVIMNISLSGVKFAFAETPSADLSDITLLFSLNGEEDLISLSCTTTRRERVRGFLEVGAFFADGSLIHYRKVEEYLSGAGRGREHRQRT